MKNGKKLSYSERQKLNSFIDTRLYRCSKKVPKGNKIEYHLINVNDGTKRIIEL